MNKKRTNLLVAILNFLLLLSIFIYVFAHIFVSSSNNNLFIMKNIESIHNLMFISIGIFNIVCAIQNKQDKRLCFWFLVFAFSCISDTILLPDIINQKILSSVLIILAIINIILMKKEKINKIHYLPYICVSVLSILHFLGEISMLLLVIFAIVMQFIYICHQDKNVKETSLRKIFNIILYYIIQFIVVIGVLFTIIATLLMTMINNEKYEKELSELYLNITNLEGANIKDEYIPVENNKKYGFMDKSGVERVHCQYEQVSYFNEIEINNNKYYIALAKKNNQYYIISKSNKFIILDNTLEKYVKNLIKYNTIPDTAELNSQINVLYYDIIVQQMHKELTKQELGVNNDVEIMMDKINHNDYYYSNNYYSMLIETIDDMDENLYKNKYNVTITQKNGETQSSIVYLPRFNKYTATMYASSNGYIEFESEDSTKKGFYDKYGNKKTIIIPNYNIIEIMDIKDNKIILDVDIKESGIYNVIMDITGQILIKAKKIYVYEDFYCIEYYNNKMVLLNDELEVISNEYDSIII